MPVELLSLSNGRLSLEFGEADIPRVAAVIRELYGEPEPRKEPMSVEYRFGSCSFTFHTEWADPCLISRSPEGDDVLRRLFAVLTAQD